MTQSQYFLNYSREIDVKWQQNSVIITKLHHIHLPAIRNRNRSNFCQECLLIDVRLFYIQIVNINDIDFSGFYHKHTKKWFWNAHETLPYQRMACANDVINKIFGSCTLFSSICRSWMYEVTLTKFEKHKFLRRRLVPHSPTIHHSWGFVSVYLADWA